MSKAAGRSVIIVGAGPAGLATGACLKQRGVMATILEAGDAPGATWQALYDRLHLHTIKRFSGLPGWPMPRSFPRYPARAQVAEYLAAYADHFGLQIETHTPVTHVARDEQGWRVITPQGTRTAEALVAASGIFQQPYQPIYPGQSAYQGHAIHASVYKNAAPYAGQRVLVIGAGNSGAEIALDLAEHDVPVTVAIRAGANVVPRELLGVPIQRWAHLITRLPRFVTGALTPILLKRSAMRQQAAGVPRPAVGILDRHGIPIIGLDFLHFARAGKIQIAPGVAAFTPTGAKFADGKEAPFDTIILATGYRPALDYLAGVIPLDEAGRPQIDGVRVPGVPNLYVAGMLYDLRGTLFNIAHEAPLIAKLITEG